MEIIMFLTKKGKFEKTPETKIFLNDLYNYIDGTGNRIINRFLPLNER